MSRGMIATLILAAAVSVPAAAQGLQFFAGTGPALAWRSAEPAEGQATTVSYYSSQGTLGVGLADLTSESVARLHVASVNGAEVVEVYPNSPAANAGFKPQDVITNFNGERVNSVRQLQRLVEETPAERKVEVAVMRDGKPLQLEVTTPERRGAQAYAYSRIQTPYAALAPRMLREDGVAPMPPMPAMPPMAPMPPSPPTPMAAPAPLAPTAPMAPMAAGVLRDRIFVLENQMGNLGLTVESLTPQLADYFGLKNGQGGLLVRSVEADSAAAKAGITAGDVVTHLGDTSIGSMQDFRRAAEAAAGGTVVARVLRHGKEIDVNVAVPARPEGWM